MPRTIWSVIRNTLKVQSQPTPSRGFHAELHFGGDRLSIGHLFQSAMTDSSNHGSSHEFSTLTGLNLMLDGGIRAIHSAERLSYNSDAVS